MISTYFIVIILVYKLILYTQSIILIIIVYSYLYIPHACVKYALQMINVPFEIFYKKEVD